MTWWQIALTIYFLAQIPVGIAIGKLIRWRVS
jgi:hypothetical protein